MTPSVVSAKLDPQGFHDFFTRWVRELAESLKGKTVAIDGKTLRGSHDRANRSSAIHLVSAWASDIRLVLGQLKTADKSNEITAIPELIKTLALRGAIVTIDAMGCQKKITQTIIEAQADYVIQVKDNQKQLCEDIALFFQEPANGTFDTFRTVDGEHGASKPGGISPPTISAGSREKTSGRVLTPSVWRSGNGK
jgi:hypothetical protein